MGNAEALTRPFQVHRWRIDDGDIPASCPPANRLTDDEPVSSITSQTDAATDVVTDVVETVISTISQPVQNVELTFPADYLLHLIHQNVYRALISNKFTLGRASKQFHPRAKRTDTVWSRTPCFGSAVVVPIGLKMPDSIVPTPMQMEVCHSTWINMIPFPRLRDNLIQWESSFDHGEFLQDIVGQMMDLDLARRAYTQESSAIPSRVRLVNSDEDDITAGMGGLIITGEPYVKESWEATPGFLKKWTWAVEGCEELVEVSNRWRVARGEDPLQLVTV